MATERNNRNLFHTAHYNIIAKQFREALTPYFRGIYVDDSAGMSIRWALTNLAFSMAKRFKIDNELFDAPKFLDACSPDADVYPLSELWEDKA